MWTRKALKARAKDALSRNYWKAVLVSLLLIMFGSSIVPAASAGGSGSSARVDVEQENREEESAVTIYGDTLDNVRAAANTTVEKVADELEASFDETLQELRQIEDDALIMYSVVFFVVFLIIIVFIIAFIMLFDVFLGNPLCVGAQRFMLKSVDGKGNIAELGFAFDHSYKNAVKTTFFRDLHIFLWCLLFVIPGIYKKYQYYMVDYILAENPDMPYKEALERSRIMMEGQKWNAFVLDLSFILWHMLSFFTCGLSEIFYVLPYINLTRASLYRTLEDAANYTGEKAF